MPRLDLATIPPCHAESDTHGRLDWLPLGDAGGLSQFGVSLETLAPGGRTSDRHWHENEDEFAYVLSGALVLVEDSGETPLGPGDAVTFAAGVANGHCLENRSDAPARFLMVGTRAARDRVHYTLLDKIRTREHGVETLTRRDGRPRGEHEADDR